MGWLRGAASTAALIGTLLVTGAAAPAAAATPTADAAPAVLPAARLIDVLMGSPDVVGATGASGDVVTVTQRRKGKPIARRQDTTDALGWFEVRLAPIRAGDRLVIGFNGTRTVTVPRLELAGNPTTDRIAGRLPVLNGFTNVNIGGAIGSYALGGSIRTVATDGAGRFSAKVPGLSGAERLELAWQNAATDQFRVEVGMTAAEVQRGQTFVQAFGRSGTVVPVTLLSANGKARATAAVRIPAGRTMGRGTFRKNGVRIKVRAGDRVRIGHVTGLEVVTDPLTLGPTGASATCFPNQDWIIGTVFGGGAFSALANGTADGTGTVTAAWAGPLSSGTVVRLYCENARGWVIWLTGSIL